MAKRPTRYPRKFRQKLEQMAERREVRRAEEMTEEEVLDRSTATLWREFLPKERVVLMAAELDERHHRLNVIHRLEPPHISARTVIRPPWEDDPESPSSTPW